MNPEQQVGSQANAGLPEPDQAMGAVAVPVADPLRTHVRPCS
jgi:hypothetical protein